MSNCGRLIDSKQGHACPGRECGWAGCLLMSGSPTAPNAILSDGGKWHLPQTNCDGLPTVLSTRSLIHIEQHDYFSQSLPYEIKWSLRQEEQDIVCLRYRNLSIHLGGQELTRRIESSVRWLIISSIVMFCRTMSRDARYIWRRTISKGHTKSAIRRRLEQGEAEVVIEFPTHGQIALKSKRQHMDTAYGHAIWDILIEMKMGINDAQ